MTKKISKEWNKWIKINLDRGCDLDEMHAILMKEGFALPDIKKSLGYEPVLSGLGENDVLTKESKTSVFKKIKSLYEEYKIIKKRLTDEIHLESSISTIAVDKSYKLDTPLAEIYCINNFLNKNECEELIRIIKKRLKPSTIATSGIEEDKNFRTSRTCDMGNLDNPLIKEIDKRICEFIGIDQKFSEMIQGQYYEVGEEFKSHTDFFEKDQMQNFTKKNGQRTFTFMVYLNDVEEGGETEFINLNRVFTPKQGTALCWNNLTSKGLGNHNTMHQAHPIKKGNKALITKWFRERNGEEIFIESTS
ncbi:2OG-Fe(II) oxygenase [Gammaproteobacteria bacterium]|nr:2OG-Fe(II) oxygenase [Gammaproteobacteria bacterium]